MASDWEEVADHGDRTSSADANAVLDALAADRERLAGRAAAPAWYYPLLGAATALIIGSPGAPNPALQSALVVLGCLGIVFLPMTYRRLTGLTITRTAGPRSLGIALALGAVIVILLGASFTLVAIGQRPWVLATALLAWAAMWLGGAWYERAFGEELRSGR